VFQVFEQVIVDALTPVWIHGTVLNSSSLNPLYVAVADILCDSKWLNTENSAYWSASYKLPGKRKQGSAGVLLTWCYTKRCAASFFQNNV